MVKTKNKTEQNKTKTKNKTTSKQTLPPPQTTHKNKTNKKFSYLSEFPVIHFVSSALMDESCQISVAFMYLVNLNFPERDPLPPSFYYFRFSHWNLQFWMQLLSMKKGWRRALSDSAFFKVCHQVLLLFLLLRLLKM